MTADEYEDSIWELSTVLDSWWEQGGFRGRPHWLLSQDNDSAHTRAQLDARGIWAEAKLFKVPALSPDMHKVVEHVHAYLSQAMMSWRFAMWPQRPSLEQCMTKLVELFFTYQPASIQADVDSLPATYQSIIANGGMNASPPHR